ncbi:Protein CHROMATIN REMODELING 5, partial [Mucuna pruriens]
LANLHMELRPHILRRVIKDVEKSLTLKIERILKVEMHYKWILERNFHNLNKGVHGNQANTSKLERIVFSRGKLVILDKLLVRLHETKHRVLIFSQ